MLKQSQKRHLKALAHPMKPVVIVGANGVTPAVLDEVRLALEHHELIKVRVNAGDREQREALIADIVEATGCELVQRIGHIAAFFRRNPDKPRITLPA